MIKSNCFFLLVSTCLLVNSIRCQNTCTDFNPSFCKYFAAFGASYCNSNYRANDQVMTESCCSSCSKYINNGNTNPITTPVTPWSGSQSHCCMSNPCQNGASCIYNQRDDYCTCKCPSPFYGYACQSYSCCDSNPCQNGGLCINGDLNGNCVCLCPPGYGGIFCTTVLANSGSSQAPATLPNCCSSNPCKNNGICRPYVTSTGSFCACECPDTFYGPFCEYDACCEDESFCQNGGQCVNDALGECYCLCPDGYTGNSCETKLITTTVITTTMSCQDMSDSCSYWASVSFNNTYCVDSYYIGGQSILDMCRKSCKTC